MPKTISIPRDQLMKIVGSDQQALRAFEQAFKAVDGALPDAINEINTELAQIYAPTGAGLVGNSPAGNVAAGTVQGAINELDSEKASKIDVQRASLISCVATGTANAQLGAFSPANAALANGMLVYTKAVATNTSSTPTFKVDGLAAKTVTKGTAVPLAIGDMRAGSWMALQFDSATDTFVLLNPTTPVPGALSGNRNRIINGNFTINQRVVSGSVVLAAGAYGHDRWKAGASGCSYTFAASGADFVLTITAGSLIQVVAPDHVEGGLYRLSQLGNAQARIVVNGGAPAGLFAALPLTSAAATGGLSILVEFSTGTIANVQLEPGTVETPFERRNNERALCERHYCKTFPASVAPANGVSNTGSLFIGGIPQNGYFGARYQFPVRMYATPTVTAYNPIVAAPGTWRELSTATNSTAGFSVSDSAVTVFLNSAGLVTPPAGGIYYVQITAESEL